MMTNNSITDELRAWAKEHLSRSSILAIADRIDAEHKKAVRELNDYASDSVLLPRDADGEVIRIGDDMERMERRGKVIALQLSNNPWGEGNHWAIQLEGEHTPTVLDAFFHHYHEPTVEDVLREMLYKAHIYDEQEMELLPDLIAEYAVKLRLADNE